MKSLVKILIKKKLKISFAESCTGGLLASSITSISGASKILESSTFAPIQYIQLIAGFVLGYLFFNDLPDIYEILGSIIIMMSGLFIIYREYTLGIESMVKDQLN